jgi:hypothetical protein
MKMRRNPTRKEEWTASSDPNNRSWPTGVDRNRRPAQRKDHPQHEERDRDGGDRNKTALDVRQLFHLEQTVAVYNFLYGSSMF